MSTKIEAPKVGFLKAVRKTKKPKNLRPIDGSIRKLWFDDTPAVFCNARSKSRRSYRTEAQRAGIRFERKVQESLCGRHPLHYVPSQWIYVRVGNEAQTRYYQLDGFLVDFNRQICTIVEVKLRHTADAWWQICYQYLPLMQHVFPSWSIRAVEICRWYDISEPFPIDTKLATRVKDTLDGEYRVLISRKNGNDVR